MAELLSPSFQDKLEEATSKVFETMIPLPLQALGRDEDYRDLQGDMLAVLGFTGTHTGSFLIITSRTGAEKITAGLLMMEPTEVTEEDSVDAMGELANMIGGNFKNHMIESGYEVHLASPTTIEGRAMHGRAYKGAIEGFALNFTADGEKLVVAFQFES